MEVKLDVPLYDNNIGLRYTWEDEFEIAVQSSNEIIIFANKAGLISLAIQLLTLAKDNVPKGCHFHYDEYNSLEAGSKDLVIQKL